MKSEALKADIGGFRARHEKKKAKIDAENRENGKTLKAFWKNSVSGGAVLAHNGIVFLAWGMLMLLVAYMSLQLAFYVIAMVLAETGGILMETAIDVVTVYVVIAMCCGFDMFFSFKIESYLIRCMAKRFWRTDRRSGTIDKGEFWRLRHEAAGDSGNEDK